MSAAEWITKRREKAERFCTGFGDTEGVGGVVAIVAEDLPRALDALDAVLAEHERGHFGPILGFRCRRCITGSAGYAVPSPWPCGTVTAVESALRGES